ncbi:MAG: class I SAM-dependent methyltransferase, partial [Candidatus Omnitrophica bacterium]|nr:class I SAM-dependent methyltransferase [Candidatus Omnitrophota bacterium]
MDTRDPRDIVLAKTRLERTLKFLFRLNARLFNLSDKLFNIPRYIDLKNLEPFFGNDLKGKKVLEIGCGKGYFSGFFAGRGAQYYGLDIDRDELSFISKRNTGTIVQGNGTGIPCKDGSFDIVFSNCVIEHIPDDDGVLSEARRVLKKDGFLIFTFPTQAYRPSFIKRALFKNRFLRFLIDPEFSGYFGHADIQEAEDWYVCHRWGHVRRGYTIDDLKGRMRLLGLEINVFFY